MSFIYFEVQIACRYKYLPAQLWHWLTHLKTLTRSSSGAQSSREKPGEACPGDAQKSRLVWRAGRQDPEGGSCSAKFLELSPSWTIKHLLCLFISLFRTQMQFSCPYLGHGPAFWLQVDREWPHCYPVGEKQFPKVKQNKIK